MYVFIEFLKKSLNSFSHCSTQRTTRRDLAVACRILAFDHREVRFHPSHNFPHHNLAWRLSQAQPSVTAPNGFNVPCLPELVCYLHKMVFRNAEAIRDFFDGHKMLRFESNQHQ